MKQTIRATPSSLELLEARIAPASVIVYQDVDGDSVRIVSSKGDLRSHVTFDADQGPRQLQTVDLTDNAFAGTNLVVTVTRASGGDGLANVGFINATGHDLGTVLIQGDLGRIAAGDGNDARPAIGRLLVRSMGELGTSTQAGGSPNLPLLGDQVHALLDLVGGSAQQSTGLLQEVVQTVESALGRSDLSAGARRLLAQLGSDAHTLISSLDSASPAQITGGLGQLLSDLVEDTQNILSLQSSSGPIPGAPATGLLQQVVETVGNLLDGQALPGTPGLPGLPGLNLNGLTLPTLLGLHTGELPLGSPVTGLLQTVQNLLGTLDGTALDGVSPAFSELVENTEANLSAFLNGTSPLNATLVQELSLLQSSLASLGQNPEALPGGLLPTVTNLLDNVQTVLGSDPGSGGTAGAPGLLSSNIHGSIALLRVSHDLNGVFLNVDGNIQRAVIGGSLLAGEGANTGEIFTTGSIGNMVILGSIVGGDDVNSGLIHAGGRIAALTVGGSISGGTGTSSGGVAMMGDAVFVRVFGDVAGNEALFSGSVVQANGSIRLLQVRGSIISGSSTAAATISATDGINNLLIGHGVVGDADHRVGIVAGGLETATATTNLAFGNVVIGRTATGLDLMAGYNSSLEAINGSAGIAQVRIIGELAASNIVAGVRDRQGDGFGDEDDASNPQRAMGVSARIGLLAIRGGVFGTAAVNGDQFGIVAEDIARVLINGRLLPVDASGTMIAATTQDVVIREVARTA